MKLLKNKIIAALIIAVVTGIIAAPLAYFNTFDSWHLKLTNFFYTRNEPSQEITIIAIDRKSLDETGLGRWNDWRRTYHAKVIREISKHNPKTIGLDILFESPSTGIGKNDLKEILAEGKLENLQNFNQEEHPDDKALAEAISKARNIILAEYPGALQTYLPEEKVWQAIGVDRQSIFMIKEGAVGSGSIRVIVDPNDTLRKIPIGYKPVGTFQGYKSVGSFQESFDLSVARHYLHIPLGSWDLDFPTGPEFQGNDYIFGNNIKIPTQKGQMYINYAAPPYHFKQLSFVDVYNGKFNPADIENKIILIGATDSLLQDRQFTPNSRFVPMPGVEIHANAIQTIIEQNFLKDQSPQSKIIVIFILAILAAIILNYVNIFASIAIVIAAAAIYTIAAYTAFKNGLILNMVYPYLTLLFTYVLVLIYRYFTETKAKLAIRNAFEHYISPKIVKQIIKNPEKLKLGGEKREVTVFFSDIKDFTTLAEVQPPERTVEILNEYLDAMTEVILLNGGTLDKYEGDAIMAFFGAPMTQEDHASRACKTALMSFQVLEKLNQKWQKEQKPILDFRVGLNSGEVIVGNIGSRKRFEYTVIGDAVNLGARLEQANKEFQTRIMVSKNTYEQAKNKFEFRKIGVIQVKGRKEPVEAYELVGIKK